MSDFKCSLTSHLWALNKRKELYIKQQQSKKYSKSGNKTLYDLKLNSFKSFKIKTMIFISTDVDYKSYTAVPSVVCLTRIFWPIEKTSDGHNILFVLL